ncbi:putative transcriptional-regulating factor 1-like [Scophthalmus maximus]|uniref:Putative transcriptional-regulating factor 1-like n=1 Tax=Scophthalmus maximus TaxID=52904 RepID=A0A2U9BAR3_SCOMX|nr:putative transcriptional-regulating factor 1-like [Scophthalmus maximus]
MDDGSSTQSFSSLHHPRHRPSFHLTLPSLQSLEAGYQPALGPLEQYGSREEESASYPSSGPSSGVRRGGSGVDSRFQNTSGGDLDGEASLRGHLERDGGLGSSFADTWYGGSKKEEVWDDGESCESTAEDLYSKGDCYSNTNGAFYSQNCGSEEELRRKLRADYNNYAQVSYEAKSETVYSREANVSHFTTGSHDRSAAGSFSDSSVGYCRTDSRVSDTYSGREEDRGSSTGSGCLPQRSPVIASGGMYTQKLDSFSEAFLSQRKRWFTVLPSGDSSGQAWDFGGGKEESPGLANYVNVGYEFQAEPPPCCVDGEGSGSCSPEDDSPREELLWKPWEELEESANSQNQVEKLLSLCSSSCLPEGGSNTELALHCLHYCQGDIMATLETLLFRQPSPAGDYHYSGSDFWTVTEKSLFSTALGTYGKDFSLVQKMVRTKSVSQCIELYFLSKKLMDKQKKQKEEEKRDGELEQNKKRVTPICQPVDRQFGLAEAVPVPPLASFFPCKLCGKMFYKIKSRNAHMKIHRQPQEDWADRRLQHQLLTQRLALSRAANLMPTSGSNLLPPQAPALTFSSSGVAGTSSDNSNAGKILNSITSGNTITPSNGSVLDPSTAVRYNNITASNAHVIANIDASDSNQREPATVLSFQQSWGSFGHGPSTAAFYCNTEGKEDVGTGTVGVKEPINWR